MPFFNKRKPRKRIHSANTMVLGQLRSILESNGIPCYIRNESLNNLLGHPGFFFRQPELWVAEEEDVDRARELIRPILEPEEPEDTTPWTCPTCQETLEPQFTLCWKCGTERETEDDV